MLHDTSYLFQGTRSEAEEKHMGRNERLTALESSDPLVPSTAQGHNTHDLRDTTVLTVYNIKIW